jgi:hypothetical protein
VLEGYKLSTTYLLLPYFHHTYSSNTTKKNIG